MRRNTPDVFWSRVDTSGGPDACHPWTGRKKPPMGGMPDGHGVYDHDNTWDYSHRYAWFLTFGTWPEPMALHRCDNPPCCNVAHMYEGTQQQNVKDRDDRNRRNVKGERHPGHKLTAAQVAEIRAAYTGERGDQTRLARQYGVSASAVHLIVKGKKWR